MRRHRPVSTRLQYNPRVYVVLLLTGQMDKGFPESVWRSEVVVNTVGNGFPSHLLDRLVTAQVALLPERSQIF